MPKRSLSQCAVILGLTLFSAQAVATNSFYTKLKSAQSGNANAQNEVAKEYFKGNNQVKRNTDQGLYWLKKSARQDNIEAIANLGNVLLGMKDVKAKPKVAIKMLKIAAKHNVASSLNNLGYAYANGIGTERSRTKAIHYYTLASTKDHVTAPYNLGMLYFKEEDNNKAYKWFQYAAKAGSPHGMRMLGVMLEYGIGVQQNMVQACRWLSLASFKNDKVSQHEIKILKTKMDKKDKQICDILSSA
jgi:TPR repeat protein